MSARLKSFLAASAFDFALVLAASTALVFTVSYGFLSANAYRGNVALVAGICAPLLLCLFAGAWSKRAVVFSALATALVAACIVGVAAALTPEGVPLFVAADDWASNGALNDVEENYVIFACVAVVAPVLVFLLSRRRVGLVALLVVGTAACGLIQFLYRDWLSAHGGLAAASALLAAIVGLFVYQSYRASVREAARARRTAFAPAFGYALLIGAVCVACGLGVFYGVVDGLALQTPEVKLFERYAAQPEEEVEGVYDAQSVEGDDTTDELDDETDETNATAPEGISPDDVADSLGSSTVGAAFHEALGYSSADPEQDFRAIGYFILVLGAFLLLVLVAALLAGAIALRRRQRERRLARIAGRSRSFQVRYLYHFVLRGFRRMGIDRPASLTPLEYAHEYERVLRPFACEQENIDFTDVTCAYVHAAYSAEEASEAELACVVAYYRLFFGHARLHVGRLRWALWYFWRV